MQIFFSGTSRILSKVLNHASRTRVLYFVRNEPYWERIKLEQVYHRKPANLIHKRIYSEAVETYKTFSKGATLFVRDMRRYSQIKRTLRSNKQNYSKLIRKEIELYHQMPKDISKVAFTLFLASLPVVFYFILPAVYVFPKQLLCSHFWTSEQKQQFKTDYLRNRLRYNSVILRCLRTEACLFKCSLMYEPWIVTLSEVYNGNEITARRLLKFRIIFECEPYNLECLEPKHMRYLAIVHDIKGKRNLKIKLKDRAMILSEMDKAILREGGAHNLNVDALQNACYIRGKNPNGISAENLIKWLNEWMKISSETKSENMSLLLHSPILLQINHK